ncbi:MULTISPECIES: sensor histidine kinase [Aeromonas]|jgi:two-component system sensor histidine kinase GlrK|uniref:histidine kinase n=1 Tax=Aeromonas piscicola TaxID=600645 RepID=A0ABT7QI61_9GAMM|nr:MULTISPECIES: HAMP domain-containing sensor histidine kinase [Aeromonas]MCW0506184.1 HAMP domain-containing histidine kinase [Aeromonas piscicola]MCX7133549.1 HAMP domain-containing histidine kinase [Aeromonas sp.]MDM5133640.1 HAMP domain-containing histidine kinase [Aeromonas piscicola]
MTKVRPRSLLQVVLMGFVLVLMPLGGMIWHDSQALEHLSQLTSDELERAVRDTRRATLLTTQAIDLERTLRRYAVLGDDRILASYQQQLASYRGLLAVHQSSIPDAEAYTGLEQALTWLDSLQDLARARAESTSPKFDEFNHVNQQLEIITRSQVDEHVSRVRATIADLMTEIWWVSGFVAVLSLLLVLLFTYLIIHPVRQIESRILSLGAGVEPDKRPVDGPAELVLLGERIGWLHDKLKELEQQKYQFLRHVSHELKTPLAVLREGADLLSEQLVGPLTPDQQEICQMLEENSRRLQTLIERLLDFNRLSQQEVFSLTPVALAPLLSELSAEYRLALESKQISVHLPTDPIMLQAEPYRLRLILDNLFSNAVSYGARGGQIWIRAGQDADGGWLEVANEGPSIPVAERERIFEPFEQGSIVRQGLLKGSGMGLSIARESAMSLGGELVLVEDEQADVCFRLTLK